MPSDHQQASLDLALDMCGKGAVVFQDRATGALAMAPTTCHRWTCPRCAPAKRARIIAMAHAGKPQRKIELTLRPFHHDVPLRYQIAYIRLHWRRLLQRIRRTFGDFEWMAALELQKNGTPHLHILQRGPYIPKRWLEAAWRNLTGSWIVWIKQVDRSPGAIGEVTKYLVKTASQIEREAPRTPVITHSRGWLPEDWATNRGNDEDPYEFLAFVPLPWSAIRHMAETLGGVLERASETSSRWILTFAHAPPAHERRFWAACDNPQEAMLAHFLIAEADRQAGLDARPAKDILAERDYVTGALTESYDWPEHSPQLLEVSRGPFQSAIF